MSTQSEHAQHSHSGHAHHLRSHSHSSLTTSATLHCLTGCAIGEFVGLVIGVSVGMGPWTTMALATLLGFVSGYSLSLIPLTRRGMSLAGAFKAIWLGETVSIAVMEFAMNFADYHVGGVTVASIAEPRFWLGYAVAVVAGFAAAWPVNWWMLKRNLKHCH